jgi:hypothetical protein
MPLSDGFSRSHAWASLYFSRQILCSGQRWSLEWTAKLIFGRELLYGYLHPGAPLESRNLEDYFTCSFAHLWRLLSRAAELRSTWRQIKGIRSCSIGACLSLVMFELVLTSDSQDSRIGSEFALQAVLVLGRNLSRSHSAHHRNMCLRV